MEDENIIPVSIKTGFIKLQDLLKLTGAADTGGQAKTAVQNGEVTVNGEICRMRGKKLRSGDRIAYNSQIYKIL